MRWKLGAYVLSGYEQFKIKREKWQVGYLIPNDFSENLKTRTMLNNLI